ncbi:MAG TPA: hypothetical protein VN918_02205 [Myxococcaceae bacterium]|nr:hypothetical protein [Myxococcaceae bacterium]
MKPKGALLQGALALIGLGAVYVTWQKPEQPSSEEVVILDLPRGDLHRIRYQDGTRWIELDRRADPAGAAYWVRHGKLEAGPDVRDGGVASLSSLTQDKTPPRELRANSTAEKVYERFEPFRASRALGTLDSAKVRELGLEGSVKTLELEGRTGKHRFRISATVLGAGSPYLQSEPDGRVYLLGNSAVSDLESAPVRLVDRTLHAFKVADFDGFSVKTGNKQREFVARTPSPNASVVAPKSAPNKPDEFARNWHDKIWRLVVLEVLGKGEVPPSGEPSVVVRIEYSKKGSAVGWLELARPGPAAVASANNELYARSEHTAGWVKLHPAVEETIKEAAKIATEP